MNGVNRFHAALVPELRALGVDARLLFTRPRSGSADPFALPPEAPAFWLPVSDHDGWVLRWDKLARFLEARAPCVYLPGYDEEYSFAASLLSPRVAVVGAVHSDDPAHYAHAARLGPWCRRVVAVSQKTAEDTLLKAPALEDRMARIPCGVAPAPPRLPRPAKAPLSLVWAGRMEEGQKRVSDLAAVAWKLHRTGVPFSMTLLGDGPDRDFLAARLGPLAHGGPVRLAGAVNREEVVRAFLSHDVFLLPSAFEGLPLALLEAMAAGCVPVAARVKSGVAEVVRHRENGLLIPVGDVPAFARALADLHENPDQVARLSTEARRTVEESFSLSGAARAYRDLLAQVLCEAESTPLARPERPMPLPPGIRFSHLGPLAVLQKSRILQRVKSRVLGMALPKGRPR